MAFSFSPSLVIFDCDGVLVDTEPVANRLLARVLSEEGFQISYEECRRLFVGRTMDAVRAHVEAALGRALRADWTTFIRDRTLEAFAAGIEPVPGACDVIHALRARALPYCVASSGKFEKMRFTLGMTGLLPLVEDVLFSAEEVRAGKPAPDLFLHAASRMGHEACRRRWRRGWLLSAMRAIRIPMRRRSKARARMSFPAWMNCGRCWLSRGSPLPRRGRGETAATPPPRRALPVRRASVRLPARPGSPCPPP